MEREMCFVCGMKVTNKRASEDGKQGKSDNFVSVESVLENGYMTVGDILSRILQDIVKKGDSVCRLCFKIIAELSNYLKLAQGKADKINSRWRLCHPHKVQMDDGGVVKLLNTQLPTKPQHSVVTRSTQTDSKPTLNNLLQTETVPEPTKSTKRNPPPEITNQDHMAYTTTCPEDMYEEHFEIIDETQDNIEIVEGTPNVTIIETDVPQPIIYWVDGIYVCDVCGKDCGYEDNLIMHKKVACKPNNSISSEEQDSSFTSAPPTPVTGHSGTEKVVSVIVVTIMNG